MHTSTRKIKTPPVILGRYIKRQFDITFRWWLRQNKYFMMSFGQPSFSRQTQCIVNVDTLPDKIQLKTSHVRRHSCQGTKSEEGIGENNKLPPLNTKFGEELVTKQKHVCSCISFSVNIYLWFALNEKVAIYFFIRYIVSL